jgi:Histidine phosphatase superfamily (branch 1)
MDIYLVRHTKTDTVKGLCYGQSDVALADSFSDEVLQLQHKLPELNDGYKVFSSPLTRCLQLAEQFSETVTTDDRLLELISVIGKIAALILLMPVFYAIGRKTLCICPRQTAKVSPIYVNARAVFGWTYWRTK